MKKNMGRLDQFLRLGLSLFLIYVGWLDEDIISDALSSRIIGSIGIASLVFALLRFCPLYTLAGFSTCPHHKSSDLCD